MTEALKRAFEAASRLSERGQDELAAAILEELDADERWEAVLARSQGALERLADEALEEHRAALPQGVRSATRTRATPRPGGLPPLQG